MGVDESIVVLQPALLTLTAQAGFVEKIDVRSNTVYPSGICSNYSSLKMAEFTETVQQDVYTIERRQANDESMTQIQYYLRLCSINMRRLAGKLNG